MREIKFRAWDHEIGVMADDVHSKYGATYKSATLMQFTGLLDKNGKEIYEGDIVEQDVNCMFDKGKHKQEVSFNGKDQFVSGNCSLNQAIESFQAEVIGNIYENPELMNI